jgi:TonB-dependent SusC/RagA subfamily outer membrane receptor
MKIKIKHSILFFLALFSIILSGFLQEDPFISKLHQLLALYNEKVPEEKVYLQIDRTLFKPGEEIWFSAFITSGEQLTPTAQSSALQVELVDPKGNVNNSLRLKISEGRASGNFYITESMAGGVYKIRAYTQWLKNWNEDCVFEKEIIVQKIVFPRVLVKMDFLKEAFGAGDTVLASLDIRNLKDEPVNDCRVSYTCQLKGQEYLKVEAVTGEDGKLVMRIPLPGILESSDGVLIASFTYEGSTESISRSVPIVLNKIDLRFFPEGGDLLAGYSNRIAFKALNEFGKPADVAGIIVDKDMQQVASFESYHQGMGAVWFTPRAGEQYFASITKPAGTNIRLALPMARKEGLMMNIGGVKDSLLLVEVTSTMPQDIKLIAQVRGKIYFSLARSLTAGKTSIPVQLNGFPAGIAQLTLFDNNGHSQCERLVFVNAHKRMNIQIIPSKEKYAPREKVKLKVKALDENNNPLQASLSLAVVNDKVLAYADDKQDDIQSQLWLSSEVNGEIYEPSFYFNWKEPKREQALDYLLMTQGWRRFKWEQVMEQKYQSTFPPDKQGMVAGQVINSRTKMGTMAKIGIMAEGATLLADEMTTDVNGNFIIYNLDPGARIRLYAHAPLTRSSLLMIQPDWTHTSYYSGNNINNEWSEDNTVSYVIRQRAVPGDTDEENKTQNLQVIMNSPSVVLDENSQSLNEVVVSGAARDKAIAVTRIEVKRNEISGTGIEDMLQGRVGGVMVSQEIQQMDVGNTMQIRGHNTVLNTEPLYVIDGIPVFGNIGNLLSPLSYLTRSDIQSIEILKNPKAFSQYGASGGNGVVLVNTKGISRWPNYSYDRNIPYPKLTLYPKNQYHVCREFYAPTYNPRERVNRRTDFRNTVYWNPLVMTDANGCAELEFNTSDELTTFRVTAEGISRNGMIGRGEMNYYAEVPVSLSLKLPAYTTSVDTVLAELILKNNTEESIRGTLALRVPLNLRLLEPLDTVIEIQAGTVRNIMVRLKPVMTRNYGDLIFDFQSARYSDAISGEIDILPYGFHVESSFSSFGKNESIIIDVGNPVEGSLKATFTAYPSVLSDLQAGMESVFREPYGCFEQVSASTYPNILALKFLRRTAKAETTTEKKALKYIREGYSKLKAYEIPGGGFEWYGHKPSHEGLTAFGLLEFIEMKEVYPEVSEQMIERTKAWLLSRKLGDGNFKINAGKYGFSGASREVSNAFIVYALAESGLPFMQFEKEFGTALKECSKSKDSYRLALLANAAIALKKDTLAGELMGILRKQISDFGPGKLPVAHTLVRSGGISAQIETAALILLAELNSIKPDAGFCFNLVSFLIKNRSYGGFGSTQGTVLALKALTRYAEFQASLPGEFRLHVFVRDSLVASRTYTQGQLGNILVPQMEKFMEMGKNRIRIQFDSLGSAIPYSVDVHWKANVPVSDERCPLDLKTSLDASQINLGQTTRFTTTIMNKGDTGLPMSVALIGIPGGLTPQPWQLKELMEKQEFAYYEIFRNYLVLYYRELGPKEIRTVNLDLKSEVQGSYSAPASSAYLYYTKEFKKWIPGTKITIK